MTSPFAEYTSQLLPVLMWAMIAGGIVGILVAHFAATRSRLTAVERHARIVACLVIVVICLLAVVPAALITLNVTPYLMWPLVGPDGFKFGLSPFAGSCVYVAIAGLVMAALAFSAARGGLALGLRLQKRGDRV